MNPRVIKATPRQNYTVHLIFDNGDEGIFDVKPYLNKGVFKELRDLRFFNSVKPFMGTIQWKNGQDFCPDTLYIESKRLSAGQPDCKQSS